MAGLTQGMAHHAQSLQQTSPRSTPTYGYNTSPSRLRPSQSGAPLWQSSSADHSPMRTTQKAYPRPAQQQAPLALRPTHTRSNSVKAFTTFSALPPSPATEGRMAQRSGSSDDETHEGESSLLPYSRSTERLVQPDEVQPIQRKASDTSVRTSTSRGLAGSLRRPKSADMLRKLSKSSESQDKGRYTPLSDGRDGEYHHNSSLESLGAPIRPPNTDTLSSQESLPQGSTRSRSQTVSTGGPTPAQTPTHSLLPTPSSDIHNFPAASFPVPPMPPSRSNSMSRRPLPRPSDHMGSQRHIPRSFSQPFSLAQPHLDTVLESRRPSAYDPVKRISDPVTGVHSQNHALFEAERGGMMLTFSPTGAGHWREGEAIGIALNDVPGNETSIAGPASVKRSFSEVKREKEEQLQSRPWSQSTFTHAPMPTMTRSGSENDVRRPGPRGRSLSDGAMLARHGTLLHPASNPQRASQELSLMLGSSRTRRLSGNKLLTPPDLAGWQEAGGQSGQAEAEKVKLEAAKKRKARVEVDVVLERECVVEGGEVRGRMEVKITGGKRGEGVRVGGGKVRVLGFEDISATQRHIFYHHPHILPPFDPVTKTHAQAQTTLFGSDADADGFRLAREGIHFLPFSFRLPLNGGAKGTFTSPGGKGPCVRYVVVGSIKIFTPDPAGPATSSALHGEGVGGVRGKRSIAHFYRQVVVLPYVDPAVALRPARAPIVAQTEKGLGWALGGEKGRVLLRVAMGRKIWVAGQRVWCEVGIRNDSTRKIKSLTLALLQTVQTFSPSAALNTGPGTPSQADVDACHTQTARRKIAEETMEADFDKTSGRVTSKGWWTGVEPGERGGWDMSLLIPSGLLSIQRTRLIEVQYLIRCTLNGSIFVDLPVDLINFQSLDPPPMPADAGRPSMYSVIGQAVQDGAHEGVYGTQRPGNHRTTSAASLGSAGFPARASSTTLHIDALLSAGRARAEAEEAGALAQLQGAEAAAGPRRDRPLSMASEYAHSMTSPAPSARLPVTLPDEGAGAASRPKANRFMSYFSDREGPSSDADAASSGHSHMSPEELDEEEKRLMAMRRAQGRQLSLAAIQRAHEREEEAYKAAEDRVLAGLQGVTSPGRESVDGDRLWAPQGTPVEEGFKVCGDTPSMSTDAGGVATPRAPTDSGSVGGHGQGEEVRASMGHAHGDHRAVGPAEVDDRTVDDGDKTILEHMVPSELDSVPEEDETDPDAQPTPQITTSDHHTVPSAEYCSSESAAPGWSAVSMQPPVDLDPYGTAGQAVSPVLSQGEGEAGYDYGEEIEADPRGGAAHVKEHGSGDRAKLAKRKSLPRQLPKLNIDPSLHLDDKIAVSPERQAHITSTRSINGSFAASFVSDAPTDGTVEVGQVTHAVRRNLSTRLPPALVDLSQDGSDPFDAQPRRPRTRDNSESPKGGHKRVFDDSRNGSIGSVSASGKSGSVASSLSGRGTDEARRPSTGAGAGGDFAPAPARRDSTTPRRGSIPGHMIADRRGSIPTVPSPLRQQESAPSPEDAQGAGSPTTPTKGSDPSRSGSAGTLSASLRGRGSSLSPVKSLAHGPPAKLSPRSAFAQAFGGESMARSGSSQLRNQVVPSPSPPPTESDQEAEAGHPSLRNPQVDNAIPPPPGLAPSVASDSASSDGHALESPPMTQHPDHPDPATARFSATSSSLGPKSPGALSPMSLGADSKSTAWQVPEHLLSTTVALAQSYPASPRRLHHADGSAEGHAHEPGLNSPSPPGSPVSSAHSMAASILLPGMKSKLAQLDARDEALRKFSVSGASTGRGSFSAAPGSPMPASPAQAQAGRKMSHMSHMSQTSATPSRRAHGSYSYEPEYEVEPEQGVSQGATRELRKRRSYTKALGSRPARTKSDETVPEASYDYDHAYGYGPTASAARYDAAQRIQYRLENAEGVGGTTYIAKQSYASHGSRSPPLGMLERHGSLKSVDTSATGVEALLARGGDRGGRGGEGWWGMAERSGQGRGYPVSMTADGGWTGHGGVYGEEEGRLSVSIPLDRRRASARSGGSESSGLL